MSDELKKMLEYLEQIFLTAGIAANRKLKQMHLNYEINLVVKSQNNAV